MSADEQGRVADDRQDFDDQVKILTSGAERSRGIIYFLGIMTAAILAVVVESDIFNWAEVRYQEVSKAFLCYTHGLKNKDLVPISNNDDKCQTHYEYVRNNYAIDVPDGFDNQYQYFKSWNALSNRYELLTRAYVESASTTLPVIGIRIDRGNVFAFSAFVFAIILYTLKLSLDGQKKCLERMGDLINTDHRLAIVLSSHMFAAPVKGGNRIWWCLFFPFLLIGGDIFWSFWQYSKIFGLQFLFSTGKFYGIQLLLGGFLVWCSWVCFKSAQALDNKLYNIENEFFDDA